MDNPEILLRGRLNGTQRNRLKRLLNMMYSPKELADEVGFSVDRVYMVYIPGGCPHERDTQRHIWINGLSFKSWFEDEYKKRPLEPDEAFCKTCKRAVKMIKPIKKQKEHLVYYLCKCPKCGRGLARIVDYKRKKNDQQRQLETN